MKDRIEVYISERKIMYMPDDENPLNMVGMIGTISEDVFFGDHNGWSVEFKPIPEFDLGSFPVRRELLKATKKDQIRHQGFIYKDKTTHAIIFDKIGFWSRIQLLFNSSIVIRCETYLHEVMKSPPKATISMTSMSWLDRRKAKKRVEREEKENQQVIKEAEKGEQAPEQS